MMLCAQVDDKNKKEYIKVFSRRYREIFVTKATLVDKREREAFILRASRTTKSPWKVGGLPACLFADYGSNLGEQALELGMRTKMQCPIELLAHPFD